MRFVLAVLVVGCGGVKGVGTSEGRLVLTDAVGASREVQFDGGALVFDVEGEHTLAVTDMGLNFHCDWARVELAFQGGRDVDRRRSNHVLTWHSAFPERAFVQVYEEELLGASRTGERFELAAAMQFVDIEVGTTGTLSTAGGDLTFDAEDCGTF